MTSFSRCEKNFKKIKIYVEIKTLNNRYLDVKITHPQVYNPFHHEISKLINARFSRGGFDIYIKREILTEDYLETAFNRVQASKAHEILKNIRQEYNIKKEIELSDLFNFNLITSNNSLSDKDLEFEWKCLKETVEEALIDIKEMRSVEGTALWKDIKERLLSIKALLKSIELEFDDTFLKYEKRVLERFNKATQSVSKALSINLEDPRFQLEFGYISERCDITEEIIRLKSHIEEFEKLENQEVSIGRKMDFFLQEMNREVNTISSKNLDIRFSLRIVEMKSEIEKIRQQVQNIE